MREIRSHGFAVGSVCCLLGSLTVIVRGSIIGEVFETGSVLIFGGLEYFGGSPGFPIKIGMRVFGWTYIVSIFDIFGGCDTIGGMQIRRG